MPDIIQRSKPTLIGLPYDAGSSCLRGTVAAPARIREALFSPATNGWSESQFNKLDEDLLFVPEKSDVRELVVEKNAVEHNLLLRNLSILSASAKEAKPRAFSAFLTGRDGVLKTE